MNKRCFQIGVLLWVFTVPLGFAESFPNWPTVAELDETVAQGIVCGNAVRERTLAVRGTWTIFPYRGLQQPFVAALQQKLESLAPSYINHVSGPLNANKTAFLFFSLATWRAAAGLNASGFRRSTNGTTFVYGIAQAGDLIGPWIWEDLRKGFTALKYTAGSISWENIFSCQRTGATPIAWYWYVATGAVDAGTWVNDGGLNLPRAYAHYRVDFLRSYKYAAIVRNKSTPVFSCYSAVPHIFILYLTCGGTTVFSSHGDGVAESSGLYVQQSSMETTNLSYEGESIGGTNRPNWYAGSLPEYHGGITDPPITYGYMVGDAKTLVQYNFADLPP